VLEQGLTLLIQSGLGSPPLASGGFMAQAPKGSTTAYTWRIIFDRNEHALNSFKGFAKAMVQIDCFAPDAPAVLTLARAITAKLNGFSGTLPDADSTFVDRCFRSDMMDFTEDPDARDYRRMLEFTIFYTSTV